MFRIDLVVHLMKFTPGFPHLSSKRNVIRVKLGLDRVLNCEIWCQLLLGDDWEHEEIFTDDDERVENDPEEREDLGPEIPAPPEIKQVYLVWLWQLRIHFYNSLRRS